MAYPPALSYVSAIIGFMSFGITLLTLLGVYRDLLSTLRSAPHQIPIQLGNLRQEILTERAYLAYRIQQGDKWQTFPRSLRSVGVRNGRLNRRFGESVRWHFSRLMEATVRDLWIEFRGLERPFLIQDPSRAEKVKEGGYWGVEDLQPKSSRRRHRGRRRGREADAGSTTIGSDLEKAGDLSNPGAGLGEDQAKLGDIEPMTMTREGIENVGGKYYRTDMVHRWIWWQSKGDVQRLMDQVQRIQIRRLERDVFECDELVKRVCSRIGGCGNGERSGSGNGSGSGSDSGGGGGGGSKRSVVRSRAGSVRSVRMPSRVGSARRQQTSLREVEETRRVQRWSAPSPPRSVSRPRPQQQVQTDIEASNTGRRRDRRRASGPRVEYEIMRPGSVYVVDDGYGRSSRPASAYEADGRSVGR